MNHIAEQTDHEVEGPNPRTQRLVESLALLILLACISCPWILWSSWGGWAGLGGILLSHVLYMMFLAPKSGICLGILWIFVFFNSVVALIALGVTAASTFFA